MDSVLYEDEPVTMDTERVAASITGMYPEWHYQASCAGTNDELFFGSSEPDIRPPYNLADINKAKKLCGGCPVSAACLRAALVNREEYGVWAGTTRKQRHKMLKAVEEGIVTINQLVLAFEERNVG